MTTVVIVLLVLYVLGLFSCTVNTAWSGLAPWFGLVGALLLIIVTLKVFGLEHTY